MTKAQHVLTGLLITDSSIRFGSASSFSSSHTSCISINIKLLFEYRNNLQSMTHTHHSINQNNTQNIYKSLKMHNVFCT